MINVQTPDGFRIFRNDKELMHYVEEKCGKEVKNYLNESLEDKIDEAITDYCENCRD